MHQLRRETLHAGIGDFGEPVGEQLRRSEQVAQVVIDLGHREPEPGEPALLMQHRGELGLHGGEFALGGADLVDAPDGAMTRSVFSGSARNAIMLAVTRRIGRTNM